MISNSIRVFVCMILWSLFGKDQLEMVRQKADTKLPCADSVLGNIWKLTYVFEAEVMLSGLDIL